MLIDKVLLKRYKVIKAIGSGAFGNTYLAIDTAFPGEPHRVVKHLYPQNGKSERVIIAQRLFKTEAECLAKLGEHDQIPRLFSYFEEDGEFYLVQELVEGHTLTQEFEPGKRWSEAETLKFLRELLEILSVVHQRDTIHRDLKPANIMRRQKDDKLVLIDFGAVKEILTVDERGQTDLSVAIGTPPYMAPEQVMGKPGTYSDIYAVGMLGIQALTGLRSKDLPQDSEQLRQIWNDLDLEIDSQLKYTLERMVSFQYKQRYPDAVEALKALVPTEIELQNNLIANTDKSRSKKPLLTLLGVIGLAGAGIFGWKFFEHPNYAQLETYLQNQQWQQADIETNELILKAAGRNSSLDVKSSETIPCKSLQTIDELWMKHSDGRFGFTPQKKVYLKTGNQFNEYIESTYEAFGNQVGWRIFGTWKRYNDFNFNQIDTTITPSGFLPTPGKVADNKQDLRIREREMLLSRFDACGF